MIKDFEKSFIKRYLVLFFYSKELSTHADVCCCRLWLHFQRDGCLLVKYLEMVRFFLISFSSKQHFSYHRGDLVSAMKKKLEKEAMEQEIDE